MKYSTPSLYAPSCQKEQVTLDLYTCVMVFTGRVGGVGDFVRAAFSPSTEQTSGFTFSLGVGPSKWPGIECQSQMFLLLL